MSQKKIVGLDGLRGIAIIFVAYKHIVPSLDWQTTYWYHKAFTTIVSSMWAGGISLLFLISGFLITTTLLKQKENPHALHNFHVSRVLRIFPLYYFALILFIFIVPSLGYTPDWIQRLSDNQLWYWTYTLNWASPFINSVGFTHLWSLALQEQFYLLWPLVILFNKPRQAVYICLFLILSAPIFRYILFNYFYDLGPSTALSSKASHTFLIARWDSLALGSLIALIHYTKIGFSTLLKWEKPILIVSVLFLFSQLIYYKYIPQMESGVSTLNQTAASIIWAYVILYCIHQPSAKGILLTILEAHILKRLAKYSYSIFIFHIPILHVWLQFFGASIKQYSGLSLLLMVNLHCITVIALSYAFAAITWRLIENPCNQLKKKLIKN